MCKTYSNTRKETIKSNLGWIVTERVRKCDWSWAFKVKKNCFSQCYKQRQKYKRSGWSFLLASCSKTVGWKSGAHSVLTDRFSKMSSPLWIILTHIVKMPKRCPLARKGSECSLSLSVLISSWANDQRFERQVDGIQEKVGRHACAIWKQITFAILQRQAQGGARLSHGAQGVTLQRATLHPTPVVLTSSVYEVYGEHGATRELGN